VFKPQNYYIRLVLSVYSNHQIENFTNEAKSGNWVTKLTA